MDLIERLKGWIFSHLFYWDNFHMRCLIDDVIRLEKEKKALMAEVAGLRSRNALPVVESPCKTFTCTNSANHEYLWMFGN